MSLVLPLLALLLVVLAIAAALAARGWPRVAALLGAVVTGPALYLLVGIAVPRATGVGHFYSFPIGALRVRDSDILLSLLAWTVACWALLALLARRIRR